MQTETTDVLVIGAGPAGSIAAAMIQKSGFSVRVVEKEKFPRFVIGESLLPRCMEALHEAGVPYEVEQQVCTDCSRILDEKPVKRTAA